MTLPTSAKPNRFLAFTLIELLVVIGIIGLLIAILLPGVSRAIAVAERSRTKADLNVISLALDQYKRDFGDYPRLRPIPELTATTAALGRKYGSECLVRSLIAPYPMNPKVNLTLNSGGYTPQATNDFFDGADGPGFRIRRIQNTPGVISSLPPNDPSGNNDKVQGEIKGPYIPTEKFTFSDTELQDRNGYPILYYPAKLVRPDIHASPATNFVTDNEGALYDTRYGDNKLYPAELSAPTPSQKYADLRYMLGDINGNGRIDNGEEPLTTGDYILISPGNDGYYGIPFATGDTATIIQTKLRKLDDVIFVK